MAPTGVCIATRTIPGQLVIRASHPGGPVHLPLLVVKCPWVPPFTAGHAHIHSLCEPGQRQWKMPICCKRPYVIQVTP